MDILEMLKARAIPNGWDTQDVLAGEAAAEIERLRAYVEQVDKECIDIRYQRDAAKRKVKRLMAVLEPFAQLATAEETRYENCSPHDGMGVVVFLGNLRRARAILTELEKTDD